MRKLAVIAAAGALALAGMATVVSANPYYHYCGHGIEASHVTSCQFANAIHATWLKHHRRDHMSAYVYSSVTHKTYLVHYFADGLPGNYVERGVLYNSVRGSMGTEAHWPDTGWG